jgi:cytochrome d ubiquinol oxidase subunit II
VSAADGVAAVFLFGAVLYTWFGFADFGAGFWDLTAGAGERGDRPRGLIDAAISPVWEVNHVWLIFLLVVTWTAFGEAFASIMTTLFIPLALGALGIVLRGANFVFRKEAAVAGRRELTGRLFGIASLLTPFFLGASIGALLAARVPAGNKAGNEVTSWLNFPAVTIGLLAVAIGAFLSATYLTTEAHRRDSPDLVTYFRSRAVVCGVAVIVLGAVALVALRVDERTMFDRFVDRSIVLLALAGVAILVTVVRLVRDHIDGARVIAALGVGLLVAAWGVAQYPYLLPFDLTIDAGAGSPTTARWVLAWFGIAAVTVIPALVLLYVLDQRGELLESEIEVDEVVVVDVGGDAKSWPARSS